MKELRFGLGQADGPQAGYWKLGANADRPDFYLFHNSRAYFHASVHGSRDHWHVKIQRAPDQKPEKLVGFNSSRVGQFERIFELVTPVACLGDIASTETGKEVVWIPPAGDAPAVAFDVFLDPLGVPDDVWPGKTAMGTGLVGRIALSTGQTASVVWRPFYEGTHVQMTREQYLDFKRRAERGGYAGLEVNVSPEGPLHIRQLEELTSSHLKGEAST